MELTQRFQDLIQDLRNHDEEQMKIKLKEGMAQRDAEFSQKEKVRVVYFFVDIDCYAIPVLHYYYLFMYVIIRKVHGYCSYPSPYYCLFHDYFCFD